MLIMRKGKVVFSGKADLDVIEDYGHKANEIYVWPVQFSSCAHCSVFFRDGSVASFSTPSFRDTVTALTAMCERKSWGKPRVFYTPLDKIILPSELIDLPVRTVVVNRTRTKPVPVVEEPEEVQEKPVVVIARRRSHVVPEESKPVPVTKTDSVKRVRAKPRAAPTAGNWLQVLQDA